MSSLYQKLVVTTAGVALIGSFSGVLPGCKMKQQPVEVQQIEQLLEERVSGKVLVSEQSASGPSHWAHLALTIEQETGSEPILCSTATFARKGGSIHYERIVDATALLKTAQERGNKVELVGYYRGKVFYVEQVSAYGTSVVLHD